MATSFINVTATVGDTDSTIYSVASGTKAILIGCNLANRTGSTLPVSLILRKSSGDAYVVKDLRVGNGENYEVMKGNKIVLASGDSLVARTGVADGFDVIASILTGVT